MPDQHIELLERHPVDQLLDVGDALQMPPGIEQQRAPGEARLIIDDAGGNLGRGAADPAGGRQQLPQRDAAVEQAGWRTRDHADPPGT
jgi:hypothetical protein